MNPVEMLLVAAAAKLYSTQPTAMALRLSCRKVVETGYAMTACDRPPSGWRCSRKFGHAGPCAADMVPS